MRIVTTLILLFLSVSAATAGPDTVAYALKIDGQPVYRHTRFLGIGVDVKRRSQEPDRLAGAVIGLQQTLQKNCSQEPDHPLLLEKKATATAVIAALKALAQPGGVDPDDRLIVDLVCHGDDTGEPRFLLAPDTPARSHSELSMAALRHLFLTIPARHKLLIVDGCRSGAMLQGGDRFDGAADFKSALTRSCCVIWTSSQAGADAASETGGTLFHNRLIQALDQGIVYDQTVLLSGVVDRVQRSVNPAASFGAPNADLILAGPESKQAPPIDPKQGRQEPLPQDAEAARRLRQRLQEQIKGLVSPAEAELLRQSLVALQQFRTADMATELPGALRDGERALVVFTLVDQPARYVEVHRTLAYLCTAVGKWKPDRSLLNVALGHRRAVVEVVAKEVGASAVGQERAERVHALWQLANTEESAGELGDSQAAREAVAHYREALKWIGRDTAPADWAMTQNNLANALRELGDRGDLSALKDAVERYKLALEVYTRDAAPVDWAATQNNLAIALESLGERGDLRAFKEAVERYKLALEVRTRDAAPARWAGTQNNLANALVRLGESGNVSALKEAILHYKLALEVRTRDAAPADWAATQNNLGIALKIMGDRGNLSMLKEAIQHYTLALEIYTHDVDPADWAMTQNNLADALESLGERGDLSALKEAINRYKLTLEVNTISTDPVGYAQSEQGMAFSFKALGQKAEAVQAFRAAAQGYSLSGQPELAGEMEKEADALK